MMPGTLGTAYATASVFFGPAAPDLSDRRRQLRFPISARIRYSLKSQHTGEGWLLNISSGGLLFYCDTALPVGKVIDLMVPWPALLHGSCPLQLRLQGRVLRSGRPGTAVRIQRYEFRTAVRKSQKPVKTATAGVC